MFSRPYSRSSVSTPTTRVGRKTHCTACGQVKPDCLWVRATGLKSLPDDAELCLCASCRSQPWAKGKIRHADPDFPTVEL
jgi:hypothetical protein